MKSKGFIMLDIQTKELVKSTIPALKSQGEDITKVFYRELFTRYPQVKSMFDMQKQKDGSQGSCNGGFKRSKKHRQS